MPPSGRPLRNRAALDFTSRFGLSPIRRRRGWRPNHTPRRWRVMQLAMIGLGRMGGNMVERLIRGGHELVVWDRSADAIGKSVEDGAKAARDLGDVTARLGSPRIIWIMVPAGAPVDETIAALRPNLAKGDILIDGGNSNFHDTMRRAEDLRASGIEFVDCGTSGGIWGL